MKLQEAFDLSNLRATGQQPVLRDKTKTGRQLANEIFSEAEERGDPFIYLTPESWTRKWLPSKKFTLVRLPLNACALPCQPKGRNLVLKKIHAREEKPIIVDYNVNQVGKALHGFTPQVIVIDGKHRFTAATIRGESHINAWVGEAAIELIPTLQAGGPGSGRRPEFNTDAFEASHGHKPRGAGNWAFATNRNEPSDSKNILWHNGPYTEAKNHAASHFAGQSVVHVLP